MLMDKKQREAAVLNGGLAELVVRQVNAEPWEPVPGMVRGRCGWCRYWFAAPVNSETPRCPDCVEKLPRPGETSLKGGADRVHKAGLPKKNAALLIDSHYNGRTR
jgi:hypothetical protein